jgi:hypothetical protein
VATVVKKSGNEIQDTGARISINFIDRRAKTVLAPKKLQKKAKLSGFAFFVINISPADPG